MALNSPKSNCLWVFRIFNFALFAVLAALLGFYIVRYTSDYQTKQFQAAFATAAANLDRGLPVRAMSKPMMLFKPLNRR